MDELVSFDYIKNGFLLTKYGLFKKFLSCPFSDCVRIMVVHIMQSQIFCN